MIINAKSLFKRRPLTHMANTKLYAEGVTYGLGEAGYDIRLAQTIHFSRDFWTKRTVEVWNHHEGGDTSIRKKGRFALASALEEFNLPTDLMGVVHDKSSWARQGLSVFNTVIEPGWRGFLTLELVYHGQTDLFIPAGSGIAQVVFHQLSDPTQYTGRYQDQLNKPVEAIRAERDSSCVYQSA